MKKVLSMFLSFPVLNYSSEPSESHGSMIPVYGICREAWPVLGSAESIMSKNKWDWELCDAARYGELEEAERATENGANIDCDNCRSDRSTPLIIASERGHKNIVSFLLSKGAKINLGDGKGRTSLDLAIIFGNNEVAHLLEASGGTRGRSVTDA